MKNLFALVCATIVLFFMSSAVAQDTTLSPSQVWQVIQMSKEANTMNGIKSPDKIWPGQTLTFLFEDGYEINHTVQAGETQWAIVQKILAEGNGHGEVVPFTTDPTPEYTASTWTDEQVFWGFGILIALIIFSYLLYKLIEKDKQKKETQMKEAQKDPVTSGSPMRDGGVTDEGAWTYTSQVAQRLYDHPNFEVREVVRGRLTGENLEISYAGQLTPARRSFQNQPAYRGLVLVNATERYVYFLQGCGNDVRMGNFFSGQDLQFIADAEISAPAIELPVEELPAQQQTEAFNFSSLVVDALLSIEKVGGNITIMFNADGSKSLSANITKGSYSSNGTADTAKQKGVLDPIK